MAIIQNDADVSKWLTRLEVAVKNKDKKGILEAYTAFEEDGFEWDDYPNKSFDEYDMLVGMGNDILYS